MPRKKFLILDTETANSLDDPLFYDIGFAVCDNRGEIYCEGSFINYDIFVREKDLMQSAYYAVKIPMYEEGLKRGDFILKSFFAIRRKIRAIMEEYGIKDVGAFNMFFDRNALNTTTRYISKSSVRWFFPFGTRFFCIWHMACSTICLQPTYQKWARMSGEISPKGNINTNAQAIYRYYHGDNFTEAHTGLEDVRIEVFIFAKAIAQHKKMGRTVRRGCWQIANSKEIKQRYSGENLQITFDMILAGALPK